MELKNQPGPEQVAEVEVASLDLLGRLYDAVSAKTCERRESQKRRRIDGDIHVTGSATDRMTPGSRTSEGRQAIQESVGRALVRVRASIKSRAA